MTGTNQMRISQAKFLRIKIKSDEHKATHGVAGPYITDIFNMSKGTR